MKTGINLHLHTNDEIRDHVSYSFIEALDKSLSLGIKITALTCHDKFIDSEKYKEEARKRGMLFIPGIEKTIEKAHVVVLNCDQNIESVNTLDELREYKKYNPNIFILAAHPYFPSFGLKNKLLKNGDIFDAVELTWFYTKLFNPNKKAKVAAEKLNLPFIATSDAHILSYIEKGYAIIDINELTIPAVFESIKNNHFENVTKQQNIFRMTIYIIKIILNIR